MKRKFIFLFFCLCCLAGFAQGGKALDLKEINSGKFSPENIYGVVPMPDGEHYTQRNAEGTQIVKYSFRTGEPVEVVFDVTKARECPFKKFDSYQFSPDGSKILIATETKPHLSSFLYGSPLPVSGETERQRSDYQQYC